MTTTIGFLGAGAIAQALASQLVRLDDTHVVLTNRRGPETLRAVTERLGPTASAGTADDLDDTNAIVLSVPWSQAPAALGRIPDWGGRLLIDTTNPIEAPTFRMANLDGETASSRVVAHHAPGAKVVKAFNHLAPDALAAPPRAGNGRRVLFHASDHPDASSWVARLITRLGFEPINLGGLTDGGLLLQFPGGSLPTRNLVQI